MATPSVANTVTAAAVRRRKDPAKQRAGDPDTPKYAFGYPLPGPQSPTGTDVMNNVFFLDGKEWEAARTSTKYDYVIIGSAFCCLTFIARMREKRPDANILIVERGPFFLPEHFQNLPVPFTKTLGGLAETFPWTVSQRTEDKNAWIKFQRGAVPFFGGRSTLWSAWCPRPTSEELDGWPDALKAAAKANFEAAEKLLNVKDADTFYKTTGCEKRECLPGQPVYHTLQLSVQQALQAKKPKTVYRVQGAPLACNGLDDNGVDFRKFSTPGPLLTQLLASQNPAYGYGKTHIAVNCVVTKIHHQGGFATALETSRGVVALGGADVIVAAGSNPAATLLRNSFPLAKTIGKRYSAHFITAVVARVPKELIKDHDKFCDLELGAVYIGGTAVDKNANPDYKKQYHIQMSLLCDNHPAKNVGTALRYMPDVVATASSTQLKTSKGYVVIVCATLGELDFTNPQNRFVENPTDANIETNSIVQIIENGNDRATWDAMDEATFSAIETTIAGGVTDKVEYWLGADGDNGSWVKATRPDKAARRVKGLVHESSVLHVGETNEAPVDLDYKLRHTANVFVTGAGLWPQGGSWNPTMTMTALAMDLADKRAVKLPKAANTATSKL